MDIVERARIFATAAHAAVEQRRKYTFEPYIVHPAEVVNILKTRPHDPEQLAAAWLHDVVEDTAVTNELITREFGSRVGEYVGWLTRISRPEYGNRAARMQLDRNFIAAAPAEVKTVKLADIISNTASIRQHDPAFARVYLREMSDLLAVLTEADPVLYQRAEQLVMTALRQLTEKIR